MSKDAATAEAKQDDEDPSWGESVCLSIKEWWRKSEESSEQIAFQLKSLIWGKTKKGVNGYVLAWYDYITKNPPKDGMEPPADVVPDVAPAHAYPDEEYPNGSDGPGEQVVYGGFRWVYNMLRAQVKNYGTNDADGVWVRKNALGSQTFNGAIWQEVEPHTIMLGQTQQNHGFFRPIITRMVGHNGNWTMAQVEAHVDALFASNRPINVRAIKEWVTIFLHKVHLNMNLTAEEAKQFIALQGKILIAPALSEEQVDNWLVKQVLSLAGASPAQTNEKKSKWLYRYKEALQAHPIFGQEVVKWTEEQLTLVASGCFDSLQLAGGLSVPTVLQYMIAIGLHPPCVGAPEDFKITAENAEAVVWETVRFSTPVGGYNIWDRATDRRWQCQLAQALYDKRTFGPDADKFNPNRSLKDLHNARLAWAHPAIGGDDPESTADADWGAPNAHACPGMDLSFRWMVAFAKKFAAALDQYEVVKGKKAEDIYVNGYGTSDPTIARKDSINNAGTFECKIIKCSDLKDADWSGKSDPYVVVRVGKVGSKWGDKRGGDHEAKTKQLENNQNPEFNETVTVSYTGAVKKGEQLELQFGVFDKDDHNLFGDDALGSVAIPIGWDALGGGAIEGDTYEACAQPDGEGGGYGDAPAAEAEGGGGGDAALPEAAAANRKASFLSQRKVTGGEEEYDLKDGAKGSTITLCWKRIPEASA